MISRDKCFPNFEFELPRPRMVRDIDMRGKATSSQLPPGLYSPRVRTGKLGALSSPRRRAVKHELTPAPRREVKMSVAELLKAGSVAVRVRREMVDVAAHAGDVEQMLRQLLAGLERACDNEFMLLATEQFAPVMHDVAMVTDRRVSTRVFKLLDFAGEGLVEYKVFMLHCMKLLQPLPESCTVAPPDVGASPRGGSRSPRQRAEAAAATRARSKLPTPLEQKCALLYAILASPASGEAGGDVSTADLGEALKTLAELELQYLQFIKELFTCMLQKTAQLAQQKVANARRLLGTGAAGGAADAAPPLAWVEIFAVAKREPLVTRCLCRCFTMDGFLELQLQELQRQNTDAKNSKSLMAQMGMGSGGDTAAVAQFEWRHLQLFRRHAEGYMGSRRRTLVDKAMWWQMLGDWCDDGEDMGVHAAALDPERQLTMGSIFDYIVVGKPHVPAADDATLPWKELVCQMSRGVRKQAKKGRRQANSDAMARLEFYASVHTPSAAHGEEHHARPGTASSSSAGPGAADQAVLQVDMMALLERSRDEVHAWGKDLNDAMDSLSADWPRLELPKWLRAVATHPSIRRGIVGLL